MIKRQKSWTIVCSLETLFFPLLPLSNDKSQTKVGFLVSGPLRLRPSDCSTVFKKLMEIKIRKIAIEFNSFKQYIGNFFHLKIFNFLKS